MGSILKAGGLGHKNFVGIPPEFAGSMAQAMEDALNELLEAEEGREPVPTDNSSETRDRRILFVAIARGVVRHLAANPTAFDVLPNVVPDVLDDDDAPKHDHEIDIITQD